MTSLATANGSAQLGDPGSVPPSLKRKHSKLENLVAPCRTPDRDHGALSMLQATPSITQTATRNFPKSKPASPNLDGNGRANAYAGAVTVCITACAAQAAKNAPWDAPGEGPDDLPPITVLPEIVSPVLSARASLPRVSESRGGAPPKSKSAAFTFRFGNTLVSASSSPQIPTSVSAPSAIRIPRAVPVPVPARASISRPTSPTDPDTHAQAQAHASLLRRPQRARRVPAPAPAQTHAQTQRSAHARDLDAALEFTPARVGTLKGPPLEGVEGAMAWVERVRAGMAEREGQHAMAQREEGQGKGEWWVESRPNTAPTAAYEALLLDAFGPGSVGRGKGGKPARKRANLKGRSVSASASVSVPEVTTNDGEGEGMDVDVDIEAGLEGSAGKEGAVEGGGRSDERDAKAEGEEGSRAGAWIAEMQVLIKGKRQLAREDLKALADTLRAVADMSAAEGQALGDDAPRLRKSLWEIAQLEEIPFGDEYGVRGWARRMLRHWPK
ncbi:hypothetical protein B0H19DRAFT_1267156 [Mycena capillaripes]|nr:hypothetical protein B0H19DRAFT_1267156 [Mycena capillaripes]